MRVVYIADDGKEFNDEFECLDYEWILNHPYLKDIHFYDKDNNKLDDIFSQDVYCKTERVVVPNENAVKDFQDFADYTGFCCYKRIVERGEWIFDNESGMFVKV